MGGGGGGKAAFRNKGLYKYDVVEGRGERRERLLAVGGDPSPPSPSPAPKNRLLQLGKQPRCPSQPRSPQIPAVLLLHSAFVCYLGAAGRLEMSPKADRHDRRVTRTSQPSRSLPTPLVCGTLDGNPEKHGRAEGSVPGQWVASPSPPAPEQSFPPLRPVPSGAGNVAQYNVQPCKGQGV